MRAFDRVCLLMCVCVYVCVCTEDSLMLLPADLDPGLASAVILHFLASLEEPLLTYKYVACTHTHTHTCTCMRSALLRSFSGMPAVCRQKMAAG